MATSNQNAEQHAQSSRGQNARRYGKMGLFAGAILGLLSGGGFGGMLQFALVGAAGSAVGGAVAGDKLNPMMDKLFGMLPFGKKTPQTPQQQMPQADENRKVEPVEMEDPMAGKTQAQTVTAQAAYRPVSEVDATVLENARAATSASVRSAGEGMSADARAVDPARQGMEWVSPDAAGKRATHGAPARSQ